MKMLRFSVLMRLLAGFVLATSGSYAAAQVKEGMVWRDAVVAELDVDFDGSGFHGRWIVHNCRCSDIYAQVEQVAPDAVTTGELLLVDGQALLARGFNGQGEDIEPLIQAPTLMLQLAFSLLDISQPRGPFAVADQQQWSRAEERLDFKLDTGLATGTFAAPWGVTGRGWKTESGEVRYELHFDFNSAIPGEPETRASMTLTGKLDFSQRDFPFDDATSLAGWSLQWISLNEKASVQAPAGLTLGELRLQAKDR